MASAGLCLAGKELLVAMQHTVLSFLSFPELAALRPASRGWKAMAEAEFKRAKTLKFTPLGPTNKAALQLAVQFFRSLRILEKAVPCLDATDIRQLIESNAASLTALELDDSALLEPSLVGAVSSCHQLRKLHWHALLQSPRETAQLLSGCPLLEDVEVSGMDWRAVLASSLPLRRLVMSEYGSQEQLPLIPRDFALFTAHKGLETVVLQLWDYHETAAIRQQLYETLSLLPRLRELALVYRLSAFSSDEEQVRVQESWEKEREEQKAGGGEAGSVDVGKEDEEERNEGDGEEAEAAEEEWWNAGDGEDEKEEADAEVREEGHEEYEGEEGDEGSGEEGDEGCETGGDGEEGDDADGGGDGLIWQPRGPLQPEQFPDGEGAGGMPRPHFPALETLRVRHEYGVHLTEKPSGFRYLPDVIAPRLTSLALSEAQFTASELLGRFPLLTSLACLGHDFGGRSSNGSGAGDLEACLSLPSRWSQLATLNLSAVPLSALLRMAEHGFFPSLTSLQLICAQGTVGTVHALLSLLPHLTNLDLIDCQIDDDDDRKGPLSSPPSSVRHDSLQRIYSHSYQHGVSSRLFSGFSFPRLRTLWVPRYKQMVNLASLLLSCAESLESIVVDMLSEVCIELPSGVQSILLPNFTAIPRYLDRRLERYIREGVLVAPRLTDPYWYTRRAP